MALRALWKVDWEASKLAVNPSLHVHIPLKKAADVSRTAEDPGEYIMVYLKSIRVKINLGEGKFVVRNVPCKCL